MWEASVGTVSASGPGEQVHHAAGHVGGGEHLGQRDGRDRPVGGGRDDRGVAGRDHRREGGDQPEQRGPLRGDDGDDAGGLGQREVEERRRDGVGAADHLGDLVGPAGVPDQPVDRLGDGGLGGPLGGALAALDLLDELGAPALEDLRDPVEHLAAVVGGPPGPAGERLPGGHDGVAGVLARGVGGVGPEAALGVVDLEGAAGLRAGEPAAEVELVGLADLDAVVSRGCHRR
jgi:hypothetical protein